jgi:hypothetical protein
MLTALLLTLVPQGPGELDAHLRNVYLERRTALTRAWDAADAERRNLARGLFLERRRTGIPAVYQLSAQFMTEAALVLEGQADHTRDLPWAQRFANSLDLLVLPGAFAAGEGRGDEVIARVLPATTRSFRPLPEQVLLRLIWVGPDGQEIRARQEPVHRTAFALPGFEMYLRAPTSKPGRWFLVPEVEHEGQTGRGFPVPVDCVLDLFGRYDRLMQGEPGDPWQGAARGSLERLIERGRRDGMSPSVDELLDGAHLTALERVGEAWGGRATLALAPPPGEAAREPSEVVVLVAPALEQPDWVFAGEGLERWQDFARARSARVFACALPVHDLRGPDVLELLAGLRARFDGVPLTLVVHGPAAGRLALACAGRDRLPFDRVVLDTVPPFTFKPRRQLPVPTLLICPLFEAAPLTRVATTEGPSLYWLRRPDPPLIVNRRLARNLADWLEALESEDR